MPNVVGSILWMARHIFMLYDNGDNDASNLNVFFLFAVLYVIPIPAFNSPGVKNDADKSYVFDLKFCSN